ncbi:MAG: sulfotransferase [Opitutaceae bacterium]|nr:sulfotransferase [Opitutaceae bacterium]
MPKHYKFLDLSGYAFTGKHAVIDLMREFEGYHVPHFAFEFCLLRIQGGILDLKTALVDDWSPIRSDAAIRRFKKIVRRVGAKNSWLDPRTWSEGIGMNYDEYFNHRFFELSDRYVADLVDVSWRAAWPFAMADWSSLELFSRRLQRRLGRKDAYEVEMVLAPTENFLPATRRYLCDLLSSNVGADTTTIVMHNAFEPFNPYRSLDLFESAKCIIVDRDPRDNFVAMSPYKVLALPAAEFVKRYRVYRLAAKRYLEPSNQILRIQYEDLVLRYEETLVRILDFLGESRSSHVRPQQFFNPTISAKNIGIWKTYPDQAEIDQIAGALSDFCYKHTPTGGGGA